MTIRPNNQHNYCLDVKDPVTGKVIIQDYECVVVVEDFDRAAGTIDIHDVYSTDGLRLIEGGELAQMLRKLIISQAKNDEWLIDAVFSRNEDDDPRGVWAKADAQYNERVGK